MRKGLLTVIENPNSKSGNYSSKLNDDVLHIYLFGNCIAKINKDTSVAELSHCGYYTHTTSCALNAIKRYFSNYSFIEKN